MLADLYRAALALGTAPQPGPVHREAASIAAMSNEVAAHSGHGLEPPVTIKDYTDLYNELVAVYRCASLNARGVSQGIMRIKRDLRQGERH